MCAAAARRQPPVLVAQAAAQCESSMNAAAARLPDAESSDRRARDVRVIVRDVENTAGTPYGGPAARRAGRRRRNAARRCESRLGRRPVRAVPGAEASGL